MGRRRRRDYLYLPSDHGPVERRGASRVPLRALPWGRELVAHEAERERHEAPDLETWAAWAEALQ